MVQSPAKAAPSESPSGESAHPVAQPTIVRYGVLAFSVSMAVLLYLDRMAISVAVPSIAKDLDLTVPQVSDSVAAFFWCYAFCQIPGGWLGDRWGGRRALTLYAVAWSLAIAGMGFVGGLVSLMVMRALLGIGQAGAYATTASFLRRWIPPRTRGFANSAVSLGGRAGGVLAPWLTSVLMVHVVTQFTDVDVWRPVFVGYGVAGLVWAGCFWWWFRDEPRLHRSCNAAEIALIGGGQTEVNLEAESPLRPEVGAIPFRALLSSRGLQLLAAENFAVNVGWIFVGTLLPTYLIEVHHQTKIRAGTLTSFTALAGMAGCLAGGLATDWLVRRVGLAWGRRLPGVVCCFGAALGYATCFALDDMNDIVAALVVSSFLGDFALGGMWATCQDMGGRYAGTVLGSANMCGNIGAACAASLVPRLAEQFGWPATFVLSVAAYSIAGVTWLGIDPRVAVVKDKVTSTGESE